VTSDDQSRLVVNFLPETVSGRDFLLLRPLADQPDRVTWKVVLIKTRRVVVVKSFADPGDRDREAEIYQQLSSLQGRIIPRLLEPRCRAPMRGDTREHALMLSWVGPVSGGSDAPLSKSELLHAKELVAQIHALGVVHRDLWGRNLVRGREPGRLFVVDFGLALTRSAMASDTEFACVCKEDMSLLMLLAEEADHQPERDRRQAGRCGGDGANRERSAEPDQQDDQSSQSADGVVGRGSTRRSQSAQTWRSDRPKLR
jgi:hypothetical protein